MITDINSEDRLVQMTFAEHLYNKLGWDSIYPLNEQTLGMQATVGSRSECKGGRLRDFCAATRFFSQRLMSETIVV